MTAAAVKGSGARVGRRKGTKDPSLVARVQKRLPKIYDAQIRAAENGSTAAAEFCVDIVRHPENYPDDGRQP